MALVELELELKYSLKFNVVRACINSKHALQVATDPDPPARHAHAAELEIVFTIQDSERIAVSLDSLWDIVCGVGRRNRKQKLNIQVKRLLATAFGTETAAQQEIDAWQDHKYVPVHIALACLWGRAAMACHSHGLVLGDFLQQLVFVTAHFHSVREQVLAQAGVNAHSTVRSDALVAPPPAVASESDGDGDGDQDGDQGGDHDGDQDGDQDDEHAHHIDGDDAVQGMHADGDNSSEQRFDDEFEADADGSNVQRAAADADGSDQQHAAVEVAADVEADADADDADVDSRSGSDDDDDKAPFFSLPEAMDANTLSDDELKTVTATLKKRVLELLAHIDASTARCPDVWSSEDLRGVLLAIFSASCFPKISTNPSSIPRPEFERTFCEFNIGLHSFIESVTKWVSRYFATLSTSMDTFRQCANCLKVGD